MSEIRQPYLIFCGMVVKLVNGDCDYYYLCLRELCPASPHTLHVIVHALLAGGAADCGWSGGIDDVGCGESVGWGVDCLDLVLSTSGSGHSWLGS